MPDAVALLLDPDADARDGALMAACLAAQHCQSAHSRIILAADASASLEVALALSAYVDARTVEGGERGPNPIVAIQLIVNPEDEFDRALAVGEIDELNPPHHGSLRDLAQLGVFGEESLRVSTGGDAHHTISNMLWQYRPYALVVLAASGSALWEAAIEYTRQVEDSRLYASRAVGWPESPRIESSRVTIVDSEGPTESVGEVEETLDEASQMAIRDARRTALIAAGLIEALASERDGRRPMLL